MSEVDRIRAENLVAILFEERIGLAVKQPLALTYGDFGLVS
jgi:hypothetical protein